MRTNVLRSIWDVPAVSEPPRRTRSDWFVLAVTLLLGLGETLSSGLGWPVVRAGVAVAVALVLLQRRRAPLVVLLVTAGITLAIGIALRIAGHYVLVTGLMFAVAVYALVRWASGRHIVIGLGVVAGHAIGGHFIDPNSDVTSALLFYGAPVLLAYALRPRVNLQPQRMHGAAIENAGAPSDRERQRQVGMVTSGRAFRRAGRFKSIRVTAVAMVMIGLLAVTDGVFITDQFAGYVTRTRSPAMPAEWLVEATTLRSAAEASRGTHDSDGAIVHTVDYPYQLLSALESSTFSVEADVTVIDGTGFLQHDPRDPVGMPLLEFLEYAAIAEFPIVKLDLKRDRVGSIIDEVQQAIDRFGLDPRRLHFNADVFRGPGVDDDIFGARKDLSFTDSMYNRVVMELETSDLIRIATEFPESTIVISATTPTGPLEQGYSEDHLDRFIRAADEIRAVNPVQALVFAVRGDLAARSGAHLLRGLTSIDNSYIAAWWSADVPLTPGEIETLRGGGVTFFDLHQDVAD